MNKLTRPNDAWQAKTPWERYDNDASFRQLVDTMTGFISKAEFTPSELRQAVIMASIKWNDMRIEQRALSRDGEAAEHLRFLEQWLYDEVTP